VSTQLRLVDTPDLEPRASRAPGARRTRTQPTARRATATARSGSTSARRAAHWGEWQLDARTRQVGRAGVAAAREALERALEQQAAEQERLRERPLAS
jgi:hypothetical protein